MIPLAAVVVAALAVSIAIRQPQATTAATHVGPGATLAHNGAGAVGTGYLATDAAGDVIFLQWTINDSELSGSAQVDTREGTPPNASVKTQTISVTGSIQGSTITLSFNGGAEVFGTLTGGSFTVNFPQQDGSLAPVTFTAATAAQFNGALARLQGNTGTSNQQAQQAQTIADEQTAINSAAGQVQNDISNLDGVGSTLTKDLGPLSANLSREQQDLNATAAQEQLVQTEASNGTDPNQVCSDADTAASDVDTVASDGDQVSATVDNVQSDVSTARDAVNGIQSDFAAFQTAQAQLPDYHASGSPTQADVNRAVADANSAISSAVSTANSAVGQANADETQAFNDAAAAASAGNCAAPAQPTTQPTIA